jgi:hypothetical protein
MNFNSVLINLFLYTDSSLSFELNKIMRSERENCPKNFLSKEIRKVIIRFAHDTLTHTYANIFLHLHSLSFYIA